MLSNALQIGTKNSSNSRAGFVLATVPVLATGNKSCCFYLYCIVYYYDSIVVALAERGIGSNPRHRNRLLWLIVWSSTSTC